MLRLSSYRQPAEGISEKQGVGNACFGSRLFCSVCSGLSSASPLFRRVLLVSVLLFVLRLFFVIWGPLDLAPDEAQYWDWSRFLDWSYVTKPPLTAWLIWLSTAVLGDTYLGVRFFALVGQSVVPVLAFLIARQVAASPYKEKAALWAFLVTTCAPVIAAGGLIMSPDVPSLTLWMLALWMITRESETPVCLRQPVVLGIVVGLAGLAKPTVALFFPLLGLYMLWQAPRLLLKPQVYLAGVVALLCQLPVFYWNATHHWAMFRHVLDQTDSDARWHGLKSLLDFLAGQAGVLGPVSFVGLLCVFAVVWLKPRYRLLWVFAAVPFMFFLYSSWGGRIQANWPVLGMVTGLVLLGVCLGALPRWLKSIFIAGFALNVTVTILLHDTFILRGLGVPLKVKNDPTKPLLGWRGLGEGLAVYLQDYPDAIVLTSRYQTTAGLAFHTPGQPMVRYINPGWRRENHYDLMPFEPAAHTTVLYVNEGATLLPQVEQHFATCSHLGNLEAQRHGLTLRTATVYMCQK